MRALVLMGCLVFAAACGNQDLTEEDDPQVGTSEQELGGGIARLAGRFLFEKETFRGNGRTCATCHDAATGTVTPAEAQRRFARDRHDPLFRPIDSDDGVGNDYSKLLADATIRVTIPLPANWSIHGSPARSVTFRRSIPTTNNVPSLDTIFMADGRNTSLQSQAAGAVNAHYQPGRQPTANELDLIAEHQQTIGFFSSVEMLAYAKTGRAPTLPQGRTASEKRGRNWFVPSATGVCGHCHAGPMLNSISQFFIPPPGLVVPVGTRFFSAFVSEFNKAGNPVITFDVQTPTGVVQVQSPDPGRALITGDLVDVNSFRIPTLWGSATQAPFFHDNSAKNLDDLAQHYSDYFTIVLGKGLTAQEQDDIIAYLKLLK